MRSPSSWGEKNRVLFRLSNYHHISAHYDIDKDGHIDGCTGKGYCGDDVEVHDERGISGIKNVILAMIFEVLKVLPSLYILLYIFYVLTLIAIITGAIPSPGCIVLLPS